MPPTKSDNATPKRDSKAVTISAGLSALDSIRDRVRAAADEIVRLRNENAELKRLLDEARARPGIDQDDVVFHLNQQPDELRRTIDDYIEMLDLYIGPETDDPS